MMASLYQTLARVAALFRRRRLDHDLQEDLSTHIELLSEENARSGMGPEEARRQAHLRVGSLASAVETHRDVRCFRWIETVLQDLRYALGVLAKHPTYSLTAILALMLGIGSTTLVFSVVDTILFRPLPYADPERLYQIDATPRGSRGGPSVPEYHAWNEELSAFEAIITGVRTEVRLLGEATPELLDGSAVPSAMFEMLGIEPVLGRPFTPEEDRPGAPPVALLDYDVWQRVFGGRDIIGESILVDDRLYGERAYTVIGIIPSDFEFPRTRADFFVPLGLDPERVSSSYPLRVYGKLRPAVTPEQGVAELETISARFAGSIPEVPEGRTVSLTPLHEVVTGNTGQLPLMLLGAVGFVLMIALANVTNLMLGHSTRRGKEIAARLSLGAGRLRIVRQLLTESLVLSILGGALGLTAAWILIDAILTYLPADVPRIAEVGIDWRVAGFATVVSVVSTALFSLYPAWLASRKSLVESFKQGFERTPGRLVGQRARWALTVAELTLAMILCIGAGLLIRSFIALQAVEIGVDPENVISLDVTFRSNDVDTLPFYRALEEAVRQVPGVLNVALSTETPMVPANNFMQRFVVDDHPTRPGMEAEVERWGVTPEYFRTLGIDLLAGRAFTERDDESAPRVLVASATAADSLWPGEDPVGRTLRSNPDSQYERVYTVVGVVEDVRKGRGRPGGYAAVYWSLLSEPLAPSRYLLVRTAGDPGPIIPALREAVWSAYPQQTIANVQLMEDIVYREYAAQRFQVFLLVSFGAVALLISAIGIFGVVSYSVARRTHEMGIRMALGSGRLGVLRRIMSEGVPLVLLGVLLGIFGAWPLTRFIESFLFGTEPTDVATYVAIAGVFVAVGTFACWVPARRATRVDPPIALRFE